MGTDNPPYDPKVQILQGEARGPKQPHIFRYQSLFCSSQIKDFSFAHGFLVSKATLQRIKMSHINQLPVNTGPSRCAQVQPGHRSHESRDSVGISVMTTTPKTTVSDEKESTELF